MMNMLKRLGADAQIVSDPAELASAQKVLLPGVGSFDYGIRQLTNLGFLEPLRHLAADGAIPLLGVCLGMQMLGTASEEGTLEGLGLIDAECHRFSFPSDPSLKVPHMGWNLIDTSQDSPLVLNLPGDLRFYFVHAYHMVCADPADVLATTEYGGPFVSMVQHGNVYGAQFHPEKSHRFGMQILKNFAAL